MNRLLDADVALLEATDNKTLASWWTALNSWEWPTEIPNPEPAEYSKDSRRGEIMGWIMERIGYKECLRDWNKDTMPGATFDAWWEAREASNAQVQRRRAPAREAPPEAGPSAGTVGWA